MTTTLPRNLGAERIMAFAGKTDRMKSAILTAVAHGSFNHVIFLGGYSFVLSAAKINDCVKELTSADGITRDDLIKVAQTIISVAKIDRADTSAAALSYADNLERSRVLYAGYPVRTQHASPDWPQVGIMPGLFPVVGETRSGKTRYIRDFAKVDLIIRAAEPFEPVDFMANTVQVGTYPEAIGLIVLSALAEVRVALDSLRGLVFNLKGTTGEGGVSNAIYELLTTLNNVSAEFGALTIVAVNPMVGEAKTIELMIRLEASVAAIVRVSKGQVVYGAYRDMSDQRKTYVGNGVSAPDDGLAPFVSDLPSGASNLMVNVDALGGDEPRSRLEVAGAALSGDTEERRFPKIPFTGL